jgi:Gas vesicle synthesis protein GvpL/GvpF
VTERGEGTGLWLYAVVRDLDVRVVGELSGIAGAPVHPVAAEDLVAVVSPVPLSDFDEAALRRNLEDLDWLAAAARAHDAVVAAVTGATTAVPLRLATVYLGESGVREMLAERRPQLRAALELLAGRTEWGVKSFADPDRLADPVAAPETTAGGTGEGAAYLRRRREQLSTREQAQRVAAEHADRLHETFAALAVATRRHAPQDPALSGEPGWMVLNGAYLVDDDRAAEVRATAERLAGEVPGVRVELTGPWSPYSFASVDWL